MDRGPSTVGVGRSLLRDPARAAQQAAGDAMRQLGDVTPSLVLVFATTGYPQEVLLHAIADLTRGAPLSGCSAEGVITQEGGEEVPYAVSVMAIAQPGVRFRTYLVEEADRDPVDAARRLASEVAAPPPEDPRVLFLFPDGVRIDCGSFLHELERRITVPVPLAGGNAGTLLGPPDRWRTFQYQGTRAVEGAVAAVLACGDFDLELGVNPGAELLGVEHTVTRSDGALVAELDGRPAFDVLREYLDGDAEDLSSDTDIHLMIGIPLPSERQEGYGTFVTRAPMRHDRATGALFFTGGDLPTGHRVQMAHRSVELIRDGALACARGIADRRPGEKPFLVVQLDCCARGRIICGDRATETGVLPLQRVLGTDVPWTGFYTFGEIAPLQGKAYYHAGTVALCALYARRAAREAG